MRNELEEDPSSDDGSATAFDLQEVVIFGLLRSRITVLMCGLAGFLGGLLWGASQPNTYRSDAKLLLRIGEREQVTSESVLGPPNARETRPTMEDELHLLRDERILKEVVAELGADYILAPPDPSRFDSDETPLHVLVMHQLQSLMIAMRAGSPEGAVEPGPGMERTAVQSLRFATSLRAEFGSNVISVSHTTTAPEKAQRITNALVDAYIRRHREHFSVQRRVDPLKDKLSAVENRVDQARLVKKTHIADCGLVAIDSQGELLVRERENLRAELFAAETQLRENAALLEGLAALLARTPPRESVLISSRTVPNPEYSALEADYNALLQRKRDLASQRLVASERLKRENDLDIDITDLLARMRTTPREVSDGQEIREERDNPLYPSLVSQQSQLQVAERGLRTRIENYVAELERVQERYKVWQVCTDLHERMDQEIRREQAAFEDIAANFNRMELLAGIDLQGETNLSVLQHGSLPADKEGPARAKLLIAGILGGLMLGCALAIGRQLIEPRVRYPGGAARILGLPSLDVVPELRTARELKARDARTFGSDGRAA